MASVLLCILYGLASNNEKSSIFEFYPLSWLLLTDCSVLSSLRPTVRLMFFCLSPVAIRGQWPAAGTELLQSAQQFGYSE